MAAPVLRPLSLGEILDVSFGLYRALFVPLLLVTIGTQGLPMVLSIYITASGGLFANLRLYVVVLMASIIASGLASAASTFILSENYMGRRLSAGDALRRSMPFLGRVIMLALLTTLLVGLGFMLFLIPGLILLAGLVLATPALVIEDRAHATDAMGRSWALSRGYRWKVLGCVVVTVLLIVLPTFALGTATSVSAFRNGGVVTVPSVIGIVWLTIAQALQMLIYPLLYCVLTVAYYDLRVRKEAFDLEVLAAGLAQA